MKKYFVTAIRWNEEKERTEKIAVGVFDEFIMAKIFKDAYQEHFSTTAEIEEI